MAGRDGARRDREVFCLEFGRPVLEQEVEVHQREHLESELPEQLLVHGTQ